MRERQKQIWITGLKLAALLALCGSLASASQVLYWQDFITGTSAIPGAITLAGDTGVAAASDTDFDAQLTSQSWSGVIIDIENLPLSSYYSAILGDLTNYVSNGGLLIGFDYDTASGGDSGFASLMQASAAGDNAASVVNDSSVLFNNISGDIGLTNPPLDVYDVTYTPTGTATGYGPSGGGSAFGIIEGTTGSGTTFLNGPLADTFTDVNQGEQLIANELASGTSSAPTIPEPGTVFLLGSGFMTLAAYRRGRRRQ